MICDLFFYLPSKTKASSNTALFCYTKATTVTLEWWMIKIPPSKQSLSYRKNAQNRPETIQRETVYMFLRFGSKPIIRQRILISPARIIIKSLRKKIYQK